LAQHLDLAAEPAQLLLLLGGEPLALAFVDLLLLDPVAQRLDADAELGGYPGDRVILVGSAHQPDRLAAKLRRVRWSCPRHFFSFA
jgi:hypothetical protein